MVGSVVLVGLLANLSPRTPLSGRERRNSIRTKAVSPLSVDLRDNKIPSDTSR